MTKLLRLLVGLLFPILMHASTLAVGDAIPAITAQDHTGTAVALRDAASKGFTLVYFYPKADTPGCTAQACSLRDAYEALTKQGVRVFGVSMDSVDDQRAFREKYSLPFSLLADTEGAVVKAFGVPALGSFAKRQAFLFKDGALVWMDTSASTRDQAKDVLAAIGSL